jgi:hypothetical protein
VENNLLNKYLLEILQAFSFLSEFFQSLPVPLSSVTCKENMNIFPLNKISNNSYFVNEKHTGFAEKTPQNLIIFVLFASIHLIRRAHKEFPLKNSFLFPYFLSSSLDDNIRVNQLEDF